MRRIRKIQEEKERQEATEKAYEENRKLKVTIWSLEKDVERLQHEICELRNYVKW